MKIHFDEIQKAMEDTLRDSFDYFLDRETGRVTILSEDIIRKAQSVLYEDLDEDMADYDDVEFDEDVDISDWMEDEVELALEIFLYETDRYIRIPERQSEDAYNAMKEFAASIEDAGLRDILLSILDGQGAFRKFKKALEAFPRQRKEWHKFNARSAKKEIKLWLKSLDISSSPDSPDAFLTSD